MNRFRLISIIPILLILLLSLMAVLPAAAAQPLPPSLWYAVVYDSTSDTLRWVNTAGEQASIPRPHLPNEQPGAFPRIAISPNGHYAVIVATLADNTEGIGFYDIAAGSFTQTHQTAPGEQIVFQAYENSQPFNHLSTQMAVGFFSGNLQSGVTWRIIAFELATGNVLGQKTSAEAPQINEPATIPHVVYYDLDEAFGMFRVHFNMIPLTGEAQEYPAFAWYVEGTPPQAASDLIPSGYTRPGDVKIISGEMVFAFVDQNYGTMPFDGLLPNNNAIGTIIPQPDSFNPTTVWVDGTRYNRDARWATSGQWTLYFSDDGANNRHWNVILTSGTPTDNSRVPISPDFIDARGVTDGFIALNSSNQIQHAIQFPTEPFTNSVGTQIFASVNPDPLRIIYTTPVEGQFTLASVADDGGLVVADDLQQPQPQPGGACDGSPVQRMILGVQGMVSYTNGVPLRVRDNPGGNILTTMDEGTVFNVIGGAQCQGDYSWWQIQTASVTGWSAEGDLENYFIEPLQTVNTNPAPGGQNPQQGAADEIAQPEADDDDGGVVGAVIITPNCLNSPQQRLSVGDNVRAVQPSGTLAMRTNATDEFPSNQIQPGATGNVIGGPSCFNGYRIWQVSLNQNNTTLTGWVYEGAQQTYYLEPVQAPGGIVAVPVNPEVGGNLAPPVDPDASDGNCLQAPQQHVGVGVNIRINSPDGTIAMRTHVTDEFPSQQLQHNVTGSIIDGWACRQGYRLWKVTVNQNGQTLTGWVSEGTQQRYFLELN
jgi:hypothetical protein